MPPHYSIQLGRWTDSDDDDETGFANEGLDALGSNPYDEPPGVPGPMPARPDMEFSLDESERNARPDMEFSPEDSENNMFGKPDMEFSPEEVDLDDEVRRGVQELDAPPVKQQTFRPATLADGDEQPGRWETTSRREAEALSMPFKGAPNGFDPNKARANRPAEWGPDLPNETLPSQGDPMPDQQRAAPQTGAWADYGALSRPDETWAGAEAPLRREAPAQSLAPKGPPGPMPAPPPDLASPQQRQPVGPSQIRYDTSARPGVTADPDGGQPDQVGVETENPDPLEARLQRGRELYIQKFGGAESPEEEQLPYSPYQPQGERQNIARMWAINTIFGNDGDNFRAAALGRGLNQDMDRRNAQGEAQNLQRWLAEHKARGDNGPISMAEVQQLIMSGVEPEAAVHAGRGATKLASSLGGIATRERKIDADTKKTVIGEREKDLRQERDQDFKGQLAGFSDETKRRGQDKNLEVMREKMAGQGQNTQDARLVRIQAAMKAGDLSKAEATDAVDNGTDSLRPSVRDRVDRALLGIDAQGKDGKAIGRIGASLTTGDARVQDAVDKGRRDPKALYKIDNALGESAETFKPAYMAIAKLKKSGALDVMARAGTEGWADLVKKGAVTAEDQADMSSAYNFMGEYAHGRYGSAFTGGEQKQLENSTGIKFGSGIAPLNDPAVILRFFQTYKRILQAREERAQKHFGDSVGGN